MRNKGPDRIDQKIAASEAARAAAQRPAAAPDSVPNQVFDLQTANYHNFIVDGGLMPHERQQRELAAASRDPQFLTGILEGTTLLRGIETRRETPVDPDLAHALTGGVDGEGSEDQTEAGLFAKLLPTKKSRTIAGGVAAGLLLTGLVLGTKSNTPESAAATSAATDSFQNRTPVYNNAILAQKGLKTVTVSVTNGHVDAEIPVQMKDLATGQPLDNPYLHYDAWMAATMVVDMKPKMGANNAPLPLASYDKKSGKWIIDRSTVIEDATVAPKQTAKISPVYDASKVFAETQGMFWWNNGTTFFSGGQEYTNQTELKNKFDFISPAEKTRVQNLIDQLANVKKDTKGKPSINAAQSTFLRKLTDLQEVSADSLAGNEIQRLQDEILAAAVAKARNVAIGKVALTGSYGKMAAEFEAIPEVKKSLADQSIRLNKDNYRPEFNVAITAVKAATTPPQKGAQK